MLCALRFKCARNCFLLYGTSHKHSSLAHTYDPISGRNENPSALRDAPASSSSSTAPGVVEGATVEAVALIAVPVTSAASTVDARYTELFCSVWASSAPVVTPSSCVCGVADILRSFSVANTLIELNFRHRNGKCNQKRQWYCNRATRSPAVRKSGIALLLRLTLHSIYYETLA